MTTYHPCAAEHCPHKTRGELCNHHKRMLAGSFALRQPVDEIQACKVPSQQGRWLARGKTYTRAELSQPGLTVLDVMTDNIAKNAPQAAQTDLARECAADATSVDSGSRWLRWTGIPGLTWQDVWGAAAVVAVVVALAAAVQLFGGK